MADVAFSYRAEPHSPRTTMDHPGQWHYVATRLMAHMGTYSRDKMNGLHRRWHQRAALRMRTAMQRHNIWAIAESPGYQGRASGHKRRRCQEVPEAPGKRHAITPQDATGGHHPGWVPPPAHTEAPSDDSPRGGTKAALIPRDAGRCARTAPENEEPWPIPAPQPHAASRSTASGFPPGYGQRPWRPQRPASPTDIICRRSPAPVQEAPHRAGAHPHHSHAGRASAPGSARHRRPAGNRRCVQLIRRLPPRVGGRPATGGTARHGHAAKETHS